MTHYSRREASKLIAGASAMAIFMPTLLAVKSNAIMKRKIHKTGEALPVVGLGTWQAFDVGSNPGMRAQLSEVLKKMKELGGAMIDSSPMYGTSEKVVGDLTTTLNIQEDFFYATKVWTSGRQAGISQMESSLSKMNRTQMDLMQIHNLVDWKTHIKTLKAWKDEEKIRYWGFTHYTDASHETLEKLIRSEQPDFVQFNYSINQRNAEKSLLNTAKDNGTAVIINRPYDGGDLFRKTKSKPLPDWCAELEIASWGQFFLKYILADEAVNCVIPGTSKPQHVVDNMKAGYGRLPNVKERQTMLDHLRSL